MRRVLLATAVVLAASGCATLPAPASRLVQRFPLWSVEHVEETTEQGGTSETFVVEFGLRELSRDPDGTRWYEATNSQKRPNSEPWNTGAHQRLDAEGLWNVRYVRYDGGSKPTGVLDAFEPPQLVLPVDPKPGDSWQARHKLGDRRSFRRCAVVSYAGCDGGVTIGCVTTWDDRPTSLSLDHHFCPGVGLVGYDMASRGDSPEASWRLTGRVTKREGRVSP